MDIRIAIAIISSLVIMNKLRTIQNSISALASSTPNRETVANQYQDLDNYWVSPELTTGLINGTHMSSPAPGQYGLPYNLVKGIGNTLVPTYGHISKYVT